MAVYLLALGSITSIGLLKLSVFVNQMKQNFSIFSIIDKVKSSSSDERKLFLNEKNDFRFRYSILILNYLYYFLSRTVICLVASFYCTVIVAYYSSFLTAAIQLFWTLFEGVSVFLGLSCCLWATTHLIMGWVYCVCTLDTSIEIGQKVTRRSADCRESSLRAFYYRQNYIYNMIQTLNKQSAGPITMTYVLASVVSVFCFFFSAYYDFGAKFYNIAFNTIALTCFIGINSLNTTGARVVIKVNTIHRLIYKLILSVPHPLALRLKALSTLDRLSQGQMGFYIGPLFCMDNYHLLVYILEAIMLYILFVTNITLTGIQM
ncbi:uncharacterized protein LOC128388911 [Panonychus citri]|uniref:uncharacterized protein LOC128388911 n=1 Tax=Panonychus citri TaxID=50023 RepID=UPI002307CFAD|nr:uncharacterized protein LOC128388911 [Panonychus citri]